MKRKFQGNGFAAAEALYGPRRVGKNGQARMGLDAPPVTSPRKDKNFSLSLPIFERTENTFPPLDIENGSENDRQFPKGVGNKHRDVDSSGS